MLSSMSANIPLKVPDELAATVLPLTSIMAAVILEEKGCK